ncbi:MAG TPA: hypothetical protein VK745_19575 [Polyangiaceae bacterium]|jgi:hypothetical protein|nr:hypothetical protein [Polyangiaceae bacterium]
MEYGFTSIEPKALEQIEGNDFEEFCEELLRFERDARHPGAEVAGTAPRFTGDAGKDLRLTTTSAPLVAKPFFSDAITEDHVGETYFSCKGGNDWAMAVLDDAKTQSAPLEALVAGGHFTVFTHRKADLKKQTAAFANAASAHKRTPAKKAGKQKAARTPVKKARKATFVEALLEVLARRLNDERSIVLSDLAARIHVYDGSHITAFLKRHSPSISSRFAVRLGIRRLEYLVSLDQWERELRERGFPQYVPDPSRTSAIDEIRIVLASAGSAPRDRAIWVHGAPGVGKSRMVLEALHRHPLLREFERRVVVARSDSDGTNAINAGIVGQSSDVILVVDECSAERIADLAATFLARSSSPGTAVLVMVGLRPPPDQTYSGSLRSLPVGPLDEGACRTLVTSTLGIEPASEQPLVERVLRLCEGYPWFAVLIANALREDRNALPQGATHWDACELALVGKHGPDLSRWHQDALRRARAVLAIMLTDGIDWGDIDHGTMSRIALGVGLTSGAELADAAQECDVRGLLRRRLEWKYKYVTPNNVARQVAIRLLAPPYHAARSIRANCCELMSRLHEQLTVLDVPPHILETLADDELDALDEDPPNLARLSRGDPGGPTLLFVGRHCPARAASLLRRLVEHATTTDWAGNDQARFVLGSVLGDLARRRAGFADAEQALYKLAVDEQRLGIVQPANSWRSLFLVNLNPTYISYSERLARIESRLPTADSAAKRVVIRALEVSISQHESRLGGEAIDGPWLQPTRAEAKDAAQAAWRVLFNLLADHDVASAARQAVLKHLRSAVRTGVGEFTLGLLLTALRSWPSDELLKVREAADLIARYDMAWLDQDARAKAFHERLLESLAPKSFHERLIDAVGRWRPVRGKATANESEEEFTSGFDEGLAREGLEGDVPLTGELDWLESGDARRGVQFMAAVGRVDVSRILLPMLEERIHLGRSHDLTAAYLSGLAATNGEADVDAILRRWRISPELSLPTLLTIWRVGPTDERISWLVQDIHGDRLPASAFHRLMLGSWGAKANTVPLQCLARALLATGEIAAEAAALSMVLARTDAVPDSVAELMDVLAELVVRLAAIKDPDTMLAYDWEIACKRLQEGGRDQTVIDAAMLALQSSESVGFADRVWTVLHPLFATHGQEIWAALAHLLDESGDMKGIVVDTQASGLMHYVHPPNVIHWIANDRGRQIAVAEMCGAYEAPLNPMARALIARYGAQSIAASVIANRAHSTPSAVPSLAQFARGQLANARLWALDDDPEVARWGARMVRELERSAEEFDAREEYEARR